MKYDAEYDSYRFKDEELSLLIHSLISYSNDPFLDHITKENIIILLENIYKSIGVGVAK